MTGFRFRLIAPDGEDLGLRSFSEPNWQAGDTFSLGDRMLTVERVLYFDDVEDANLFGMLQLVESSGR